MKNISPRSAPVHQYLDTYQDDPRTGWRCCLHSASHTAGLPTRGQLVKMASAGVEMTRLLIVSRSQTSQTIQIQCSVEFFNIDISSQYFIELK